MNEPLPRAIGEGGGYAPSARIILPLEANPLPVTPFRVRKKGESLINLSLTLIITKK